MLQCDIDSLYPPPPPPPLVVMASPALHVQRSTTQVSKPVGTTFEHRIASAHQRPATVRIYASRGGKAGACGWQGFPVTMDTILRRACRVEAEKVSNKLHHTVVLGLRLETADLHISAGWDDVKGVGPEPGEGGPELVRVGPREPAEHRVVPPPARILSLEPASQSVAGTRVWKGVADGSVTVGGGRWAKWSTALKIQ